MGRIGGSRASGRLWATMLAWALLLAACADTGSSPHAAGVDVGGADAGGSDAAPSDADSGGRLVTALPQARPTGVDDFIAPRVDIDVGRSSDAWSPPEHIERCNELLECRSRCRRDTACIDACYEAATDEAKSREQALVSCINSAGCGDEQCIMEKCGRQMDACFGG